MVELEHAISFVGQNSLKIKIKHPKRNFSFRCTCRGFAKGVINIYDNCPTQLKRLVLFYKLEAE